MKTECEFEWSRKFLRRNFPLSFINKDLKAYRAKRLFDTELSMMPATMPIVEQIVQIENEVRDTLVERCKIRIGDANEEKEEDTREFVRKQNLSIRAKIWSLSELRKGADIGGYKRQAVVITRYVRRCLYPSCNGFLNNKWECGLCSKKFCVDCHEMLPEATEDGPEPEAHVCNPDTVATVSLLRDDSKPCPKCNVTIFKIEGCDQMYCTQCHTAFSWRTGAIETGRIHNPHYYDYRRQHGGLEREEGDEVCGARELNIHRTIRTFSEKKLDIYSIGGYRPTRPNVVSEDVKTANKYVTICRKLDEYRAYREQPRRPNNVDLRIAFLLKELSPASFKKILQQQDRKYERMREIFVVKEFLYEVVKDICLRFEAEIRKPDWKNDFTMLNEITAIKEHANELLDEIAVTYSTRKIRFADIEKEGIKVHDPNAKKE